MGSLNCASRFGLLHVIPLRRLSARSATSTPAMLPIDTLVAQYFQLVELPRLALPSGHALVNPATQQAIHDRMFDASLWPLPPISYQTRVLKTIIARIEESIADPEEDV